jgi:predicted MFS family arabinose efflux permease
VTDDVVPRAGFGAYRAVLRIPGAAAFSGAGAIARLPQAMIGLGSVLLLTGLGRSYTLAGFVGGAISLSQGIFSPQVSRLADRLGQTRVLVPQTIIHAVTLVALVMAARGEAPGWILVALGAAVGSSMPQIGAFARARWTALLPGDRRVDTALAVESLVDEVVFIVGPVIVTTLATSVSPAAGMVTATIIVVLGCALFVAQWSTEPAPRSAGADHESTHAIRRPGLLVLVAVFFGLGGLFGMTEVSVVAVTREAGHAGSAGTLLALWATGSLIAGIAYGAVHWRSPARGRFLVGVAGMALGTVMFAAAAGSLPLLTAALFVGGIATAPTLITGNTLVPLVVPASAVTEAYTWLGVIIFAGAAVGSPIAGALIDHHGGQAALWAATVAGALAMLAAIAGRRWLAGSDAAAGAARA